MKDVVRRARVLRPVIEKLAENLTDEQALELTELFQHWDENGHEYHVNDRVSDDEVLYKVLQDHVSQPSWKPANSPSLFVRVDNPQEEWPEWVQPTGATDAYKLGAKVSHNDKHWISDVDGNVWEPGVAMWTEAQE